MDHLLRKPAATPGNGAAGVLHDLARCVGELRGLEFFEALDALQERLAGSLATAYGDSYAALVALKVANFAAARWHHRNRHQRLASRPVSLMFDPSNACQLRCPGCVHSETAVARHGFEWPKGMAKLDEFERLMRWVGPFAFNVVYFNYGEPLLHKDIADFLLVSNRYGLSSTFSTNLSLPLDAERFVAAAPDYVILSIDGITQDVYSFYRRRGDLGLVLDNVRRLVEARRRLGRNRPFLSWRFFTFEHNVHQVDDAIDLARRLGVDQIDISTPNDISEDDGRVRVTTSPRQGIHTFAPWTRRPPELIRDLVVPGPEVEALFRERWVTRARAAGDLGAPRPEAPTCTWLYYSMTVDAVKRVMPCCLAPSRLMKLTFGSTDDPARYNAPKFDLARLAFADRRRFHRALAELPGEAPYCADCQLAPALTHAPVNAVMDLHALDYLDVIDGRAEPALAQLQRWA